MFRIDSEGATLDNKFTEGDPSLGVPATVVSAAFLNSIQEELAGVVEANGITLNKSDTGQLHKALLDFFLKGGRTSPLAMAIANNQTTPADVTGFTADSAKVKAKFAIYDIERKTATINRQEMGLIFITRDTADSQWRVSKFSLFDDDMGVTWSMTQTTVGQLQYVSDNMSGGSYASTLKITSIFEFRF